MIIDCCDGSDEYASGITCEVTCASLMTTFTTEKRELLDIYDRGHEMRNTLVITAQSQLETDQARISTLESEISTYKTTVASLTTSKEQEELLEKKEKHRFFSLFFGFLTFIHELLNTFRSLFSFLITFFPYCFFNIQ